MNQNSGAGFSERLYRNLSTGELQNELRCMTFAEGELDIKQTDQILSELKRRNVNLPERPAEDAWREFQAVYADLEPDCAECGAVPPAVERTKPHRRKGLILIAATIAALLVSLVTVQAAGFDVWGAIARWTTELFGFGSPARQGLVVDGEWPEVDVDPEQTFSSLQDALNTYGVMEIRAPTWVPDGYALQNVTVAKSNVWLDFIAIYRNAKQESLIISCCSSNDAAFATYEKVAASPNMTKLNERAYYSIDNSNNISVIWSTEHFECLITGPIDTAEGMQILDSIPE